MGDVEITFHPDGRRGRAPRESTILETARRLGVDISSVCGGRGRCGMCVVRVVAGESAVSPVTEEERALINSGRLSEGYRLACSTAVLGDVVVEVPPESRRGRQRLQTEGLETGVPLDPAVVKLTVRVEAASISDPRSDEERTLKAIADEGHSGLKLSLGSARRLPSALREGGWTITTTIIGGRVIDVEPGDTQDRRYGVAIDLGTTKLASYLLDLSDGALLAAESTMNPQIPFGDDVISRITCTIEERGGLEELRGAVINGVNEMLDRLCERSGVRAEEVYEATVVGNTAMHHIFLGIPPGALARSPYAPAVSKPIDAGAGALGIEMNAGGNVHALPVIAGFVGSDCIAGILATGVHRSREVSFFIDVGTNTEIVVGSEEGLAACSCASGPAFEGAHIVHGMRAASGAIERLWIDRETLEAEYQTIDDAEPLGICGSGIVDALAEMLRTGVVDRAGRIGRDLESPRVRAGPGGMEYVIVESGETATGRDIVVTQGDVMELLKAKAAMYSGASILMGTLGLSVDSVERVYLAGAFGSYLDPGSARTIGMFPEFQLGRIRQVGNSAGTGARMALLSREARIEAEQLRGKVTYVELASHPGFGREYARALFLPHMELDRFPVTVGKLRGEGFRKARGSR
jgi:uncharacterized 2Fe-2S/4Fe-4S cluster protein (DUF4445 family)